MKLLLVIVGFVVVATAIDMTPVLRESILDSEGMFRARLRFTGSHECQRIFMTVDPLFVVKRAPNGKLVFVSLRSGSIIAISRSEVKREEIQIVVQLHKDTLEVRVNGVANRIERDGPISSIQIDHPVSCDRDAVYSKEFKDETPGEQVLLADDAEEEDEADLMAGVLSAVRIGYHRAGHAPDPAFWSSSVGLLILNVLLIMALGATLLYEHFHRQKYIRLKRRRTQQILLRRELEKKFPEETIRMRGVRPMMHVKGLTKIQPGHMVTFKTNVEHQKDNDTQPSHSNENERTPKTVDKTQKSKDDKTRTQDSASDVRVIEDSKEEKDLAAKNKTPPKKTRKTHQSVDL